MKLPSFVRVAKPHRFHITPRHYDPIKEEIEQRTSAIKRELEEKGILDADPSEFRLSSGRQSAIRGAFKSGSKAKSSGVFERSGLLRLIILVLLLAGLGGYLYLGTEVLFYLVYLAVGAGMLIVLKRLKRSKRNE